MNDHLRWSLQGAGGYSLLSRDCPAECDQRRSERLTEIERVMHFDPHVLPLQHSLDFKSTHHVPWKPTDRDRPRKRHFHARGSLSRVIHTITDDQSIATSHPDLAQSPRIRRSLATARSCHSWSSHIQVELDRPQLIRPLFTVRVNRI